MTKQKSGFQQNKVDEILEKAARNILNIIESGKNLKWEKEWKGEPLWGMPFNPVSGHVFTGFNRLLLLIEMHDRETQDPRFLTFNQIAKLNEEHGTQCHVRKGEKACYLLKPVIFNKKRKAGEEDEAEQDQDQEGCSQARTQKAVFFQAYPVFHSSQIEGMPDLPKAAPPDWEQDDFIEELLDASGARLRHGGDRAYFSPREDVIQMPFAKDFTSKAAYYSTMLHEWYHWTGHSSRNNREFGTSFGDELYALEEIRAESLSVMAGMALGLPVAIDNHAAYLQSWAKKLETKEGVKEIIKGMNDAGKMLDVILTFKNGAEPVIDWWPDKMVEETESESGFSLV